LYLEQEEEEDEDPALPPAELDQDQDDDITVTAVVENSYHSRKAKKQLDMTDKGNDSAWDFFNAVKDSTGKKIVSAVCMICSEAVSPRGTRLRDHLLKLHSCEIDDDGTCKPYFLHLTEHSGSITE